MKIVDLDYNAANHRHYYKLTSNSNSDAIRMLRKYDYFTVQLSNLTKAKVQYSLDTAANVINDTALWHDWAAGEVTEDRGLTFDSPINFIRVVSSSKYTLEVLT